MKDSMPNPVVCKSRRRSILLLFVLSFLTAVVPAFGQEERMNAEDLITQGWKLKGEKKYDDAVKVTDTCIRLYKDEALRQQAGLKSLPDTKIESVWALNNVAIAYFIQGEIYRELGSNVESIKAFKAILEQFCFAQGWDQRGWYWSVAFAARDSILKLNADEPLPPPCPGTDEEIKEKPMGSPSTITLHDPGTEEIVNYAKYGTFEKHDKKGYRYVIKDQEGLSRAVGEGIFPNTSSVRWDPQFKQLQKEGRLDGSHWDFVNSPDLQAAFLKWSLAPEPPGVRLFYTALILERSGLVMHALKCYYAIVVHFPGSYGWTYWHTPWYVGQAALAKIRFLLRRNPNLGLQLEDADITIENGFDAEVSNDVVIVNPGRFVKKGLFTCLMKPQASPKDRKVSRTVGQGNVRLVEFANGDWQLVKDNKPYTIKAITYTATKVGQSPDNGTLGNWMEEDSNKNGKPDGPYDAFVDKNRNNLQDADEPAVGDFRLMQEMGINTIRLYHHPTKVVKEVLRDLYKNYGIMVIMGDFLGKYAIGSGAPWSPGTDYANPEHQKNMMESVVGMVREFKDEPYVLFWLLGNENVYGYACNADKKPDAFFSFANQVAQKMKEVDPNHLVAISSGDILFLDRFSRNCPDIDIFGTNAYRGDYGFGHIWKQVRDLAQKPVFFTEYGCPAHARGRGPDGGEAAQADYHRAAWEDIELNMAFGQGQGNAIGGVVFEWMDEWWKAYEPLKHDIKGLFTGPFPDGYMHEEWLGVCGQGDGKLSPFLRQLRQAYYGYKRMWNK